MTATVKRTIDDNKCRCMDLKIVKTEQLPTKITMLARLAQQEANTVIEKLISEYQSGENCFAGENEFLLCAYDGTRLIGCGGLNQQCSELGIEARIGRIRRFYVDPAYRRYGIGKQILAQLEQLAREHYSALCLQTETKLAAHFYQKQNYVAVESHPNYNYFKYLI
jgi:GNAT superfamily N-acetyltransferase